jgi:hypothetical protein
MTATPGLPHPAAVHSQAPLGAQELILAIEVAVLVALFLLGGSIYSRWRRKPRHPGRPQPPRKRTPMGRNDAGRRNLRLVVSRRR